MLKVFRDRNENENNFMLLNITQNILLYILERIMNKNTQVFFFSLQGKLYLKIPIVSSFMLRVLHIFLESPLNIFLSIYHTLCQV